ncbi:Uncharacterised protein [Helicobacter canadensis]|nr:Uncharacterised protein [Helicobacter canadensis]
MTAYVHRKYIQESLTKKYLAKYKYKTKKYIYV